MRSLVASPPDRPSVRPARRHAQILLHGCSLQTRRQQQERETESYSRTALNQQPPNTHAFRPPNNHKPWYDAKTTHPREPISKAIFSGISCGPSFSFHFYNAVVKNLTMFTAKWKKMLDRDHQELGWIGFTLQCCVILHRFDLSSLSSDFRITQGPAAAYRMVTTRFLSTNLAPPTFPCIAGGSLITRLWSPASISSSEPPLYCIFTKEQVRYIISNDTDNTNSTW